MTDDRPRLYLIASGNLSRQRLIAAIEAGDVACVLLRDAGPDSRPLVAAAQDRGTAVLVADLPAAARQLGADGVHLGPGGDVKAARKALAEDAVVGASCGESRHDAMLAAEAGADYVAFYGRGAETGAAANPEILDWWQTMMTVPCVAMGRIALPDVHALAEAGADFVALEEAVWSHPDGPAAAVATAQQRLDAVVRRR